MTGAAYHHGRLREALVEEAVAAARAHGPGGVGLRELARRVGVSHNAAYRHFAHREDLLVAVADHAMTEVVGAMRVRLADLDAGGGSVEVAPVLRARRRLTAIGRAYVDYALREPGLFQAAFAALAGDGDWRRRGQGPLDLLGEALDELVDVGFLAPAARPGAEVTCWSAVHGFAMLTVAGPLAGVAVLDRAATLDTVLTSIDRSYAATTGSAADPADLIAGT
ncbi:TetR/AcrR family transcriptional regulator [Nocardioides alkalitolerans]|uniref:TetR/AcrR family transcriptional regulator n=1 Tax=Nocardioides alkalitolerans TaxID=281714 RepID=UPI0003FCF7E4|nr:TetR/AcrR family transcriptional regulator [Nocardioides alkalitolerans]